MSNLYTMYSVPALLYVSLVSFSKQRRLQNRLNKKQTRTLLQ